MRRREFIQTSALAGAAIGIGSAASLTRAQPVRPANQKVKNILVMGGTGFIGPHIVNKLIEEGHTVTLFNRGKTNPHLFPHQRKLVGDRSTGDLEALKGQKFDVVIDTNAYFKRAVVEALNVLKDNIDQYVLISTISVYPNFAKVGITEDDPTATIDNEEVEEITGTTYGPLKALCEQAAEEMMPGRVTVIRPGLIVGPRDNTDRWTYWPVRIQQGGRIIAPGPGTAPLQLIDVRDLANFVAHTSWQDITGVYNCTGPAHPFHFTEMLFGSKGAIGGDAEFVWIDPSFLEQHHVSPWQNLPLWIPAEGDYKGFASIDCSRAIKQGLHFRPIGETARATIDWWNTLDEERRKNPKWPWLSRERQAEVIRAWDDYQANGGAESDAHHGHDHSGHDHPHE